MFSPVWCVSGKLMMFIFESALEDALQVLQSFVESSSIGEFAMRVNILRVSASSAFGEWTSASVPQHRVRMPVFSL